MGQLENMQIFARIVESGSITKAADQLNLAKSAVSKRLSELENNLDTKLLIRTTRKSHLTEAGNLYYQRIKLVLEEVDELHGEIASTTRTLHGTLKLTIPLSFGLSHLTAALNIFIKQHPEITIDVNLSDNFVDLVTGGFDLALRIGHIEDSTMQAKKITTIKHILCASPQYLSEHSYPHSPSELTRHQILKYSSQSLSYIKLLDKKGKEYTITSKAHMIANNGDFLKSMALEGHGIVLLPTFIVCEELKNKILQPILTDYTIPSMYLYALYPGNRYLPHKVRSFIDFLSTRFGNTPYWDNK